ncbi:MAG: RluA family pseudouridine synthase [Mariprofundus sp.]|nr:RluA family pseudouridine synthase [Mariprofundus sp.]
MASNITESGVLIIDADEDGSRLDRVLVRQLGTGRRSLMLRLIRKGNVRINKKRCKPETRVVAGDAIYLPMSLREADEQERVSVPLSLLHRVASMPVLYEDEWLLVVDKPAGMVVHGGSGHEGGLIEALKESRGLSELRLAHRLDRDTSGVLLMAKNLASLRHLADSFRQRDMQKTYFALISKTLYPYAGRMRSKLSKGVMRGGERMVVDADDGKESITDYQVMMMLGKEGFDFSLIALHPHSGRTHQLRVQLQNEGHAILGDGKYGAKEELTAYKAIGGKGLMLHAWRLRFDHPMSGKLMEFKAAWPASWHRILPPRS